MKRRDLFGVAATIGAGAVLAGCATTTLPNGTREITLNVAQANAWGQAVETAGKALLGISAVSAALGAGPVSIVTAALGGVATALGQINAQAAGKLVLTYTPTTVSAAVTSLATDASTILNTLEAGLKNQPAWVVTNSIQSVLASLSIVVAAIQAFVGAVGAPNAMSASAAVANINAFALTH